MDTTLANPRTLTLTPSNRRFVSPQVVLDEQTDRITVKVQRPTVAVPLNWGNRDVLGLTVVVVVDGVEYRCRGRATGGVRSHTNQYALSFGLPMGFFGARDGNAKRLCEGRAQRIAWIEAEVLEGRVETQLLLATARVADSPLIVPFKNSVAFDTTADAYEQNGDGVLSWSHTSTGSNLGGFATAQYFSVAGSASTSMTWGGTGMTEMWDLGQATYYRNAGYRLAGQGSGSQTVTSTVADGSPWDHVGRSISMTGVDQTTPVGTAATATGSGTAPSVTVGSVGADDLVVDSLTLGSTTEPNLGSDQRAPGLGEDPLGAAWSHLMNEGGAHGVSSYQLGAAGGVMSWSTTSSNYILGAVAFKPAGGGGASRQSLMLTGMGR